MVTDIPPRQASRLGEYQASDQHVDLAVPADDRLRARASAIESAMKSGKPAAALYACNDFIAVASDFYRVKRPELRVLSAGRYTCARAAGRRNFFGDYHPETLVIRVWMRTAVRKQVTSYGTFFSTLCHEFCHHLDCKSFAYVRSPHTRGFYQRAAVLYHHARERRAEAGVDQDATRTVEDRLEADERKQWRVTGKTVALVASDKWLKGEWSPEDPETTGCEWTR